MESRVVIDKETGTIYDEAYLREHKYSNVDLLLDNIEAKNAGMSYGKWQALKSVYKPKKNEEMDFKSSVLELLDKSINAHSSILFVKQGSDQYRLCLSNMGKNNYVYTICNIKGVDIAAFKLRNVFGFINYNTKNEKLIERVLKRDDSISFEFDIANYVPANISHRKVWDKWIPKKTQ